MDRFKLWGDNGNVRLDCRAERVSASLLSQHDGRLIFYYLHFQGVDGRDGDLIAKIR